MSAVVLDVQGVSKRYASYTSVTHRALGWFDIAVKPESEFRAVNDISFKLNTGEAVAIIGPNGAGKSTLLKMITGTVRPTAGRIWVGGRINALLELGLGFNPEFTGRQNVFMAGGMMGLSGTEIEGLIGHIIDFAELGDFFELPLRVYSSGMQARLAFSVATAVRPDLLIVDEILSVGDSYFQHKSFDRIRRFKEDGVAILFVTHGMSDVRALCDRVILLDKGTVLKDGLPDEVVDYYNALIAEKENAKLTIEQRREKSGWLLTRSGTRHATAKSIDLLDEETGVSVATVGVGQRLVLRIVVEVDQQLDKLVIGLMLRDRTGHIVWGTNTWHTKQILLGLSAGEHIDFEWPFRCFLGPGSYGLSYALTNDAVHTNANYEWVDNAVIFDVINSEQPTFVGTSYLDPRFQIKKRAGHG
jgi:lipopolysaccharide transport system ATP-binding protein